MDEHKKSNSDKWWGILMITIVVIFSFLFQVQSSHIATTNKYMNSLSSNQYVVISNQAHIIGNQVEIINIKHGDSNHIKFEIIPIPTSNTNTNKVTNSITTVTTTTINKN